MSKSASTRASRPPSLDCCCHASDFWSSAIMTRHPTINTIQFPTSSPATTASRSTVDLPSLVSPRHLYADTFTHDDSSDGPYSRSSTRSGRPLHKNMRDMIGATTEDEFDALPITVRRKVRSVCLWDPLSIYYSGRHALHAFTGWLETPNKIHTRLSRAWMEW